VAGAVSGTFRRPRVARDLRARGGVATEVLRATSEFDFGEGAGAFYGYHEST
jgi:hypothetical protein